MRTFMVGAACALAVVVGLPASADAIVNGSPADRPYPVGSLQYDNGSDPNWPGCGVWVHDAWHVATNAHCVTNRPTSGAQAQSGSWAVAAPVDHSDPSIYHIRLGSLDRTSGGQVYHVRKIVVAESWAWGVQDAQGRVGDIALLTLDRPVRGLAPAVVRPVDTKRQVREVGWGKTEDNGSEPAQILQQIDVSPQPRSACGSGLAPMGVDEVCLGRGGACDGDSGTAAFQRVDGRRWVAVGSSGRSGVSRSVPCSQSPAIYTDLAYYATWLWQHAVA